MLGVRGWALPMQTGLSLSLPHPLHPTMVVELHHSPLEALILGLSLLHRDGSASHSRSQAPLRHALERCMAPRWLCFILL